MKLTNLGEIFNRFSPDAGMLMKKMTIVDVAKRSGVSKGTVSAVINAKKTVKTHFYYLYK